MSDPTWPTPRRRWTRCSSTPRSGRARFLPDASTARFAGGLARRPGTTGRRLRRPGGRGGPRRRRHLHDRAVAAGPPIRRPGVDARTHCCAACCRPTSRRRRPPNELVDDAGLGWRDEQRVRFLVENLVEALSPSNLPLVNPASAKAAVDTGGLNFLRGGLQPAAGHGQRRRGYRRWWTDRRSRSAATSRPRPARWCCAPSCWS